VIRNANARSNRKEEGGKIIFVTGTDTGVGKTLLTALLLHHLRQSGCHALAMKPFCSGSLADVNLLFDLQDGELSRAEINPFYFTEPVAPLVAARKQGWRISLKGALKRIHAVRRRCDCLLIEGAGGVMVPLAEKIFVVDLIAALDCKLVIVARNKLGVINHMLLTAKALSFSRTARVEVVLMGDKQSDLSARTNQQMLAELLVPTKVFNLPFLGSNANNVRAVKKNHRKIKKTLAQLSDSASFGPFFSSRQTVSKNC